jgi:hypothetical protein
MWQARSIGTGALEQAGQKSDCRRFDSRDPQLIFPRFTQ